MNRQNRFLPALLILLAACLMLPLFAACNNQPTPAGVTTGTNAAGSQEESVTAEDPYADHLGAWDFEGKEFHSVSVKSEEGTYTEFDVEEMNGSIVDEAIFRRNREIEQRFKVFFVTQNETYQRCKTILDNEFAANSGEFDLIQLVNRDAYASLLEGKILVADEIPHIDMSRDYYQKDLNEMCRIKGVNYFAYSDEAVYTLERAACLVFNSKKATDYQMGDLYDLVDNKEWTVEKLFELMKIANVKDANGNTECYGIYGQQAYIFTSFWFGIGETMLTRSGENMKFTVAKNENLIRITERVVSAIEDGTIGFSGDYSTQNWNNVFKNGAAMFNATVVGKVYLLRDIKEFDYGVLPYPLLNEEQESYHSRVVDAWIRVVPRTCRDFDRAGVILEALASGSRRHVIPAYYENTLLTKALREPRSVDMLELIRQTRIFDLADVTWSSDIRSPIDQNVFIGDNGVRESLSTFCAKIAFSVNKRIQDAEASAEQIAERLNLN